MEENNFNIAENKIQNLELINKIIWILSISSLITGIIFQLLIMGYNKIPLLLFDYNHSLILAGVFIILFAPIAQFAIVDDINLLKYFPIINITILGILYSSIKTEQIILFITIIICIITLIFIKYFFYLINNIKEDNYFVKNFIKKENERKDYKYHLQKKIIRFLLFIQLIIISIFMLSHDGLNFFYISTPKDFRVCLKEGSFIHNENPTFITEQKDNKNRCHSIKYYNTKYIYTENNEMINNSDSIYIIKRDGVYTEIKDN